MNKKGFTLIELLAVIVIIVVSIILIVPNITKNIQSAKTLLTTSQIESIENAAYIYSTNYSDEIPNLESLDVATVSIQTLISKGLLKTSDITINGTTISTSNLVVIARINDSIKTKYDVEQTGNNIIFLKGLDEISISKDEVYTDMGAYVAIVGTGVIELTESNMISDVNTSVIGEYTVTYSYTDSISSTRIVKVI